MKAAADDVKTNNFFGEVCRAICLRENLTSSSYVEGLETGRVSTQLLCQSLTRQLFFCWIKQHLHIKLFCGTPENTAKTQIWIAFSVYLIVAIIKKHLNLEISLLHFYANFECNYF